MVQGRDGVYIAWDIFEDYATKGSIAAKETVKYALDLLLGEGKTVSSNLPSQAVLTLTNQPERSRFVLHTLFATPVKRGENIEVIEDIVYLYNIEMSVKTDKRIKEILLVPQNTPVDYSQDGGKVNFMIQMLQCHQIVVLEY